MSFCLRNPLLYRNYAVLRLIPLEAHPTEILVMQVLYSSGGLRV